MQCSWIIGERHGYWNIKGWGHFVVFVRANCLCSDCLEGPFRAACGTTSAPFSKGDVS
jgi:hypothetical protein